MSVDTVSELSGEVSKNQLTNVANLFLDEDSDEQDSAKDQPALDEPESDSQGNDKEAQDNEPTADDLEDEANEPEDAEKPVDVTLKDGTKVTLAELESGYLRQSDYTRKTQELAQERQSVVQSKNQIVERQNLVASNLDLAIAVMDKYLPKQPLIDMFQGDTYAYLMANEAYQSAAKDLNALMQAKDVANSQQDALFQQELDQSRWSEIKTLHEKLPEFSNREFVDRFTKDAINIGGKAYGLDEQEIAGLASHKEIMILADAIKYQKLLAKKADTIEKVKATPKMLSSGSRRTPSEMSQSARLQQMNKLSQSGDVDDAVKLLADLQF